MKEDDIFEMKKSPRKPVAIMYFCKGCGEMIGYRIEGVMEYCTSSTSDQEFPNMKTHIMRIETEVTFSCCIEVQKKCQESGE